MVTSTIITPTKGAVTSTSVLNNTPLHARMLASIRARDAEELKQVLMAMNKEGKEKKEDVNTPTIKGDYAIHLAARLQGQAGVDCIKTLVNHKAKV